MASLQQIISWFQTGLFPTADQFKQTWLSYWHKSEKIPQSQIFGLKETIESATRGLIYQDPVPTKSALATTYPNAKVGWASMVQDEGYIYSFNGTSWANTGLEAFPDNVATKEDIARLERSDSYIQQSIGDCSKKEPYSYSNNTTWIIGEPVKYDVRLSAIGLWGVPSPAVDLTIYVCNPSYDPNGVMVDVIVESSYVVNLNDRITEIPIPIDIAKGKCVGIYKTSNIPANNGDGNLTVFYKTGLATIGNVISASVSNVSLDMEFIFTTNVKILDEIVSTETVETIQDDIKKLDKITQVGYVQIIGNVDQHTTDPLDANVWIRNEPVQVDSMLGSIQFKDSQTKINIYLAKTDSSGKLIITSVSPDIIMSGKYIDIASFGIVVPAGYFFGIKQTGVRPRYGSGGIFEAFYFPANATVGSLSTGSISGLDFDIEYTLLGVDNAPINLYAIGLNKKIGDILKQLTGLVWCSMGDSITWYNNHPNGTTITTGYQNIIMKNLEFSGFINQGVSGIKMTDWASRTPSYAVADLYTVAFGTNDFFNTPIGLIGTLTDYINNTGEGTFCGAIRKIVDGIFAKNINAKVIFITPIWASAGANEKGYTQKDYAVAIKQCCSYDAIPVIDLFAEVQINRLTISKYTIDGVHPNDAGFQLMANIITSGLRGVLGLL